jgi:hypothetical protein
MANTCTLAELPPDEREADAAGITALGIDLDDNIENIDETTTARLRQFLLRRRAELRQQVAALRAKAQKKRRG